MEPQAHACLMVNPWKQTAIIDENIKEICNFNIKHITYGGVG